MHPILNSVVNWGMRNAPKILATIGVCGVAGTAIMAAKAAPEANKRISEIEWEPEDGTVEKVVKTVKAAAPVYAPAAGMGIVTVASFLGSQHILSTRQAAAAIAGSIAETALKDYQDAAIKTIGEKKHQAIMDEVAKKHLHESVYSEKDVVNTGHGDTLCYDCMTGRYFRSSIEHVRQAEAETAKRLLDEYILTLNTFYEMLGLDYVDIGDKIGWYADRDKLDISFSSQLHPQTDTPVLVLNYDCSYLGRR